MWYVIHCIDAPGTEALRITTQSAHRAYIADHLPRLLFGGPLQDESGSRNTGSLIVLRADSHATAAAFIDAEPYCRAGVFGTVTINRFHCVVGAPSPTT